MPGIKMPDTSNAAVYESFAALGGNQILLPNVTGRFSPFYTRSASSFPDMKSISFQTLVSMLYLLIFPMYLWENFTVNRVRYEALAKNERIRMKRLRLLFLPSK